MSRPSVDARPRRASLAGRAPRRRSIRPSSLAILVVPLTMCALFFCVPALCDHRHLVQDDGRDPPRRDLRAAARPGHSNPGYRLDRCLHRPRVQRHQERLLQLAEDPLSRASSFRSRFASVTGYALALWNVRWANPFLFMLFMCAFVPFQIIMYPADPDRRRCWTSTARPLAMAVVHAILAMPMLTLIFRNFFHEHSAGADDAAMMDFGQLLADLLRDHPADVRQHSRSSSLILLITSVWNDFLVGLTFGGFRAHSR